jgi:hypothetical protein
MLSGFAVDWKKGAYPIAPGGRVILVGNGPSALLGPERGEEIDEFEHVVRFNAYALTGFEDHVGSKTSLWSTFGRGMVPRDPASIPEAVIHIHGGGGLLPIPVPVGYGISREFFAVVRETVRTHSKISYEGRLKALLPSSGLLVALWVLGICGADRVTLHGFDHFKKEQSKGHHYWINQAFGRPSEHDGDAEEMILARLVKDGRVRYF